MSRVRDELQASRDRVTLAELVILVLVLAIVAAIVVPQYSRASQDGRLTGLRTRLATVRAQISQYEEQHNGQLPTAGLFAEQMTSATDVQGKLITGAFGAYSSQSLQRWHNHRGRPHRYERLVLRSGHRAVLRQ